MWLKVCGIFLDISKAFDKVWHYGLIFKLRQNGICREMINILVHFLSGRKSRFKLSLFVFGWSSRWCAPKINFRTFVILIYINDLSRYSKSKCKLCGNETSLFSVIHDNDTSANDLNHDLEKIIEWAFEWKLKFNPDSSKQTQIILSRKNLSNHPVSYFNDIPENSRATYNHLRMILDSKFWKSSSVCLSTYSSKKIYSDNL